jgi:hypothetical protein
MDNTTENIITAFAVTFVAGMATGIALSVGNSPSTRLPKYRDNGYNAMRRTRFNRLEKDLDEYVRSNLVVGKYNLLKVLGRGGVLTEQHAKDAEASLISELQKNRQSISVYDIRHLGRLCKRHLGLDCTIFQHGSDTWVYSNVVLEGPGRPPSVL